MLHDFAPFAVAILVLGFVFALQLLLIKREYRRRKELLEQAQAAGIDANALRRYS